MNKLKEKGIKYNIEESLFRQTKMEYLGFWVTRDGVKPFNRKTEAITNMNTPNTQKEVRNFIGVINSYRNMSPRRLHTLVTLIRLTYIKKGNLNGRKSNNMPFTKLSGLWHAIIYQLIRILMKHKKFIPMLAGSN